MEDIPNACFWAFCSCWYYSSSMHFYFACLLSDSRNWYLLLGLSNIHALFSLSTSSLWVTDHSRIVYFFLYKLPSVSRRFILFMNTTYDIVKKQDTVVEIRWMRWKANLYLLCIADMAFEFYCSSVAYSVAEGRLLISQLVVCTDWYRAVCGNCDM